MTLVTVDAQQAPILSQKTIDFKPEEFPDAVQRAAKLLFEGIAQFPGSAGMAAPQIGVSRSIFVYSYDRQKENLTIAVNPTYEPLSQETRTSWEGCLSVINSRDCFQVAKIPRYTKIKATYQDATGKVGQYLLEEFAAKVFQHECDHLHGILNICHPQAELKSFLTKDALSAFIAEVRGQDAPLYKKPEKIG